MPILKKEEKRIFVKNLIKESEGKSLFLTTFKGLTVAEMSTLRRGVKERAGRYTVIKNTFLSRSFEALKMQDLNQFLKEPIGVVYSKGDIIVMSKFLVGYAKENEKFHVRAAWLDGRYCETDQIKVLASLPGRQELLSLLAGTLQAPISQLVCSLNAVITKLVLALEEIKKKKT